MSQQHQAPQPAVQQSITLQQQYPEMSSRQTQILSKYNYDYSSQAHKNNEHRDVSPKPYIFQKNDLPLSAAHNPTPSQLNMQNLSSVTPDKSLSFGKQPLIKDYEARTPPQPYMNLNQSMVMNQQPSRETSFQQMMGNSLPHTPTPSGNLNDSMMMRIPNNQSTFSQQSQQQQQQQQQHIQMLTQLLQSNVNQLQQQQQQQPSEQQFSTRAPQMQASTFGSHLSTQMPSYENPCSHSQEPIQEKHLPLFSYFHAFQQQQPQPNTTGQQVQQQEPHKLPSTPLESNRLLNESFVSNNLPHVPQQHQHFVQNYSQLHDNLNQYRKLISYLETIDHSKKGTNPNQPHLQTMQMNQSPQVQQTQPVPVGQPKRYDPYQQQQPFSEKGTPLNSTITQEDRHKFSLEQVPKHTQYMSSSADLSFQYQEQSFRNQNPQQEQYSTLWPSSTFNMQAQPPREIPSSMQDRGETTPTRKQLNFSRQQDSFIDSNTQHISSSVQKQQLPDVKIFKVDNEGSPQQHNEGDISKASGDLTKESYTEQNLNPAHQTSQIISQSEGNKSLMLEEERSVQNRTQNSDQKSHHSNQKSQSNNISRRYENEGSEDHNHSYQNQSNYSVEGVQDKPIVSNEMTFEELLERKLQEEKHQQWHNAENGARQPKRDYLRKSSNNRCQASEHERGKSKSKQYTYYADNFSNQKQGSNQTVQKDKPASNSGSKQLVNAQSPKTSVTSSIQKIKTLELTAQQKKTTQFSKSNQKQPKQQSVNKVGVINRPASQQQTTHPTKKPIQRAPYQRSRQNAQSPKLSQLNSMICEKVFSPLGDEGEEEVQALHSDRNSVLEFEQLEQECILKYQRQHQSSQQKENSPKSVTDQKSIASETSAKARQQQHQHYHDKQVPNEQQQIQLDRRIQELDKEILKFREENKRVLLIQSECEAQLRNMTKKIEQFEEQKVSEIQELEEWKEQQREEVNQEKEELQYEREEVYRLKEVVDKQNASSSRDMHNEIQDLISKMSKLSRENQQLKEQVGDLTNKEGECIGTQTLVKEVNESGTNTDAIIDYKFEKSLPQVSFRNEEITAQKITEEEEEENREDSDKQAPFKHDKQEAFIPRLQQEEDKEDMEDEDEDSEEDDYDLKYPQQYHGKAIKGLKLAEEVTGHDGKIQRIYENGKKEVIFTNGVKREVWPDGYSIVFFNNNDIKQTYPDGRIVYYFSEAQTTQSTFPNGLQVFKFANSQIEKHFADGTKEISFPDGTIKCLFPDGEEESIFPDGTIQKIEKSGVRLVDFPNGQRDILYPDGTKVREFEDGTVKRIHSDGRQEILKSSTQKQSKQTPIQRDQIRKQ